MPFVGGALVFIIQAYFAYHALKTGRPYWWIFVIMAFPVMGCVLYYFLEVFPNSRKSRSVGKVVNSVAKAIDPDKNFRSHVADLETCGSVENRIALARECITRGMNNDACELLRSCLTGVHQEDPDVRFELANALLLNTKYDESREVVRRLLETHPSFRPQELHLLYAKALEATNQLEASLAGFSVLANTYPGEEERWRYRALLKRIGRSTEAQEVFRKMITGAERTVKTCKGKFAGLIYRFEDIESDPLFCHEKL